MPVSLRRFAACVSGLAHAVRPAGSAEVSGDRVGDGVARPLPHHRTCGPASGGSSSRLIETLPGRGQGLDAKAVPVGVGQGYLQDLGASNPPVSLAASGPFTRRALAGTGTPSNRSPPPGFGDRQPGGPARARYVPASSAWRTAAQCSRSHGTSSSVVMPSTPGAPASALTRLNARPRFSAESIRSRTLTSRPGMTASSGRAGRPLRSAAVLNGTHRLLPAAGPRPRDGCDHRDQHEQHRFLRLTRRSVLPGHDPIPGRYYDLC